MRRWMWVLPLMAGCVPLSPTINRDVELVVSPHFVQKTQAVLNSNTLSTIATLDIVPYIEVTTGNYSPVSAVTGNPTTVGAADTLKLTQASPSIDPNRPFIIRKLKAQKNYRIFGQAYNAANALISQNSSSYVDVQITNNDAPEIAQLPIRLIDTPFGATTSVTVNTEGRYDYLKSTLYQIVGNAQIAVSQTVRSNPTLEFTNLQGNTNYRLVLEAYKLGNMVASTSVDLAITNETAPLATSVSLNIPYVVTTLIGNGTAGNTDGAVGSALLNGPHGVALDSQGNLYVADHYTSRIRKLTPQGVVSTMAGSGADGFADGNGVNAVLYRPNQFVVDPQNTLYFADQMNHRIRKMTPDGTVTTIAGSGAASFAEGNGAAASFNTPTGIARDLQGNILVADYMNNRIRKIDSSGNVTTFAGSGAASLVDGTGAGAAFNGPHGITVGADGTIYVADGFGHSIRKITPAGVVTTLVGNGTAGFADGTGSQARLSYPHGIITDLQGNIFVVDRGNNRIRKVTPAGVITTLAGNGTAGFADGTGFQAMFSTPTGLAIDSAGKLYVGDSVNHRVRVLN